MSTRRQRHSRQASVDYPRYPPLNSTTQQRPSIDSMLSSSQLPSVMPSDYESDNQGYISDYPFVNPPITRTKEELNLAVIQKHNPEITQILSVAPYATIYEWAHSPGEPDGDWQKSGQIGTLFICQLTPGEYGEERYHAIVLNRGGLDNFNAELRQSEKGRIEISGDFVIITREPEEPGKEPKLNAIFLFSEEGKSTANSRIANGDLMIALAEVAKTSREAAIAYLQAQSHPIQPNNHGQMPMAQQQPSYHQPIPAPQIAPQLNRPANNLLALFQGHPAPYGTEPAPPPQRAASDVFDVFRRAGLA